MKITNSHGVSLPLAVWLLHDDYDYNNDENYISATSLLKSTKQFILSRRIPYAEREMDVSDFIAARFGHAVHDSIEKAWTKSSEKALKLLGYPEAVTKRIIVNPTPEYLEANPDTIPVYMEKRSIRDITVNGKTFKVGGKLDIAMDGRLFDTKTTSVYSYLRGNKDDDYSMQGSIYRWLNPDIITDEHVHILFIFTDWQKAMTKSQPNYPKLKILEHPVLMHSPEVTERFITSKVEELLRLKDAPEDKLPRCTDKELWRSEPQFKYFSDPNKTEGRSTKNFDSLAEANNHKANAGKGVVITKPGEVKACLYCAGYDICNQRREYFAE